MTPADSAVLELERLDPATRVLLGLGGECDDSTDSA